VRALIIDIDGVVLRDEKALPGASEFIAFLRAGSFPFLFLTNYPSQTPADIRNRFLNGGLDVPPEHFYTSAMATAEFLNMQAGERRRAFVIGEGALIHALYQIGFTLTDTDADFVILGETRSFNFDMIQIAGHLIQKGARFVATNPDVAGPYGRPSCGALAAPIERITGRQPFYVGKPSAFMMRAALRHMNARTDETWIVGDNMDTDIIAGIQSGMQTVLVLTGVSGRSDLQRYAYRPDHIVDDLFQLVALMQQEAQPGGAGGSR
jgi:NagD protein